MAYELGHKGRARRALSQCSVTPEPGQATSLLLPVPSRRLLLEEASHQARICYPNTAAHRGHVQTPPRGAPAEPRLPGQSTGAWVREPSRKRVPDSAVVARPLTSPRLVLSSHPSPEESRSVRAPSFGPCSDF